MKAASKAADVAAAEADEVSHGRYCPLHYCPLHYCVTADEVSHGRDRNCSPSAARPRHRSQTVGYEAAVGVTNGLRRDSLQRPQHNGVT